MNEQASRFVDAARGLAALAVLFTHVEAHVLVAYADIPADHRGLLAALVWFFYGFAHQAVVVFFVLSGFLVGGAALSRAERGQTFLSAYLLDRTARIYLVLVPTLLVTLALDMAGRRWFAGAGIYDIEAFANRSSLGVFAANLASLQDIFAPYFGTNSALWTLSHEFWYYVTFGLFAASLSPGYSPRARKFALAASAILLAVMSASLSYHLFGFALWLTGVAAARMARAPIKSARLALAIFLGVAIGLRLGLRYSLVEIWWIGGLADAAVALSFAGLLAALRFDDGPVWRFSTWRIHARLSEISYSLYAVHMPVLVFLCAAAQQTFGIGWRTAPVHWTHWALVLAILAATIAIARLFWRLAEARTPQVRALAHNLAFGRRRAVAGAGPQAA